MNPHPILNRCGWCETGGKNGPDPRYLAYHDQEWGVPQHDDHILFEFLLLEGAQAGLSWLTILRKRENYRHAFEGFNPQKIARYTDTDRHRLLQNPGIIRNRLKIEAAILNARQFLAVQEKHGSFDHYLWQFVDGQPIQNHWRTLAELPASTPLSEKLSKDLQHLGFRFVGPTICYSLMQAVGMVNDHLTNCFRHADLKKPARADLI